MTINHLRHIVAISLLAASVAAAAPASRAPAERPSAKDSRAAAAPKGGGSGAKPASTTPERTGPDAAALRATMRAKSNFMLSVELCERKDTCSPELLDASDREFVAACERCADARRCAEERQLIRDGKSERKKNPCS